MSSITTASDWSTTFIATLSGEDSPSGKGGPRRQRYLTARVSPNGRYLAFMSDGEPDRAMTTKTSTSGTSGERIDEEVYLYDSRTRRA